MNVAKKEKNKQQQQKSALTVFQVMEISNW